MVRIAGESGGTREPRLPHALTLAACHVLGTDHFHDHVCGRTGDFILLLPGTHLCLQLRATSMGSAARTIWPAGEACWMRMGIEMGMRGQGGGTYGEGMSRVCVDG